MRRLHFLEPNFRITVRDPTGAVSQWLEHAETEEALRRKYEQFVFQLEEVQPYDFNEWKKKAAKQTDRVLKAMKEGKPDRELKFNEALWRELKQYLFLLAGDRCGYCESHVPASSPGAVEHYRPKRKVEEDPEHPGYFWLAYDVTNYIPSCTNCNSGKGKMNQFPVAGTRARAREDNLEQEKPLLLNPFTMDPSKYLRITPTGDVIGIDDTGRTSEKVYGLNRGHLSAYRRRAMDQAVTKVKLWLAEKEFRKKRLPELLKEADYPSASMVAALDAINAHMERQRRELEELKEAAAPQQEPDATDKAEAPPGPPAASK